MANNSVFFSFCNILRCYEKSGAALLFLFVINYYYNYNYYHLCFLWFFESNYLHKLYSSLIICFGIFAFMLYQSRGDVVTHLNGMGDVVIF